MAVSFKRIGIFLQARLNSSRLQGKALLELSGKPVIVHAMERLSVIPADVRAILTTKDAEYAFKPLIENTGWDIFVGERQNVLKRFVDAAIFYNIDTVIRATADNPLVSSEIAFKTIELYHDENCDLAYLAPIPYGSGVEIVNTKALIQTLQNVRLPYDMEHVTPYIYAHKDKFKIRSGSYYGKEYERTDVRLSIDTREDFERTNYLLRNLGSKAQNYKIDTIIKTWDETKFNRYKRILVITAFTGQYGMGHLKRQLYLIDKLKNDYNIYLAFKQGDRDMIPNQHLPGINFVDYNHLEEFVKNNGQFDRVILDIRDTDPDEMLSYLHFGPVISFDDLGEGGKYSDINFKTLPVIKEYEKRPFNYSGLEYLLTPPKKPVKKNISQLEPQNILITFGGSDPENLTQLTLSALYTETYQLKVINGPYFKDRSYGIEGNYQIIDHVENIEDYLKETDLVITSFGMTFIEALQLNIPVLVINPTDYHEKLTRDFDYPYYIKHYSKKGPENQYLPEIKNDIQSMISRMVKDAVFSGKGKGHPLNHFFNMKVGTSLNEIIKLINKCTISLPICPYCSHYHHQIIHRTMYWNMYLCPKCDLYYLLPIQNVSSQYEENYFVDEYKSAYGKTYEEDKDNIRLLAGRRLAMIKTYLDKGHLLDYGSGLGFFAEYCEKNGFSTVSQDISAYAVTYIQNVLNLNAIQGEMERMEKSEEIYDVITSFYVLEHIKDFEKLIFLFSNHLKKYGVLALATPNAKGISVKYHFNQYIQKHPDDHYHIFSPGFLKKVLKKYGFSNIKIVITGIHPERFIRSSKLLKSPLFNNLVCFLVRKLKLGDTFEIYAQKTE